MLPVSTYAGSGSGSLRKKNCILISGTKTEVAINRPLHLTSASPQVKGFSLE